MTGYTYEGSELELFANAVNWKTYFSSRLARHLRGRVLEVGAGIGGTTRMFLRHRSPIDEWICLEPDSAMAARLQADIDTGSLPSFVHAETGTLQSLSGERSERSFDAIIYMDVLEHIEDDRAEVANAASRLSAGGKLLVLSPAHPFLFSEFDRAIGHHRRYTRTSLRAVAPPHLKLLRLEYLDSVGLLATLANRLLLRQELPTRGQIALWDRAMVPLSRLVDPLLGFRWGKSVVGIWEKP